MPAFEALVYLGSLEDQGIIFEQHRLSTRVRELNINLSQSDSDIKLKYTSYLKYNLYYIFIVRRIESKTW